MDSSKGRKKGVEFAEGVEPTPRTKLVKQTQEEDWSEWEISLRHLRMQSATLGAGKFGVVRRANWRGTPVAIKLLHNSSMVEDKELFVKELRMMRSLHHPNIVQFLGFVLLPDLAIVMELFPERSVQNYVEKEKWLYYSTARRFCYEMALGVGYLHGRRPRMLIHRDIKPSNYMLTGSLRVKLGDFGVSRIFSNDMDNSRHGSAGSNTALDQTSNCGTVRFMAPEVHATGNDKSRYSPKADIFSLGLVFYYVFEHKLPSIPGVVSPEQHIEKLMLGQRPHFIDTPRAVREIINRCWSTNSVNRPSADDLIGLIRDLPEAWSWPCCGLRQKSRAEKIWTDDDDDTGDGSALVGISSGGDDGIDVLPSPPTPLPPTKEGREPEDARAFMTPSPRSSA